MFSLFHVSPTCHLVLELAWKIVMSQRNSLWVSNEWIKRKWCWLHYSALALPCFYFVPRKSNSFSSLVCLRVNINLEVAGFNTMGKENNVFKVLLADIKKWTREVSVRYICYGGTNRLFNSRIPLLYFRGRIIKRNLWGTSLTLIWITVLLSCLSLDHRMLAGILRLN